MVASGYTGSRGVTLGRGAGQMDTAHDNPRNQVPRDTEKTKDTGYRSCWVLVRGNQLRSGAGTMLCRVAESLVHSDAARAYKSAGAHCVYP